MYPEAYIDYLVHFHGDRDWFECHELLEEYWKEHPDDPKSATWVGLIQLAVSLYHQRRGNRAGALKMLTASLRNMQDADLDELGIDGAELRRLASERLELLTGANDIGADEMQFADLDIPLANEKLLGLCRDKCREKGFHWKQPSNTTDPQLIHRHTLRDRSEVILARAQEAQRRSERRGAPLNPRNDDEHG